LEPFGRDVVIRALVSAVKVALPDKPRPVEVQRVDAALAWADDPTPENAERSYEASRTRAVDGYGHPALDAATEHLAQAAYLAGRPGLVGASCVTSLAGICLRAVLQAGLEAEEIIVEMRQSLLDWALEEPPSSRRAG